jgi:hypothetical protein
LAQGQELTGGREGQNHPYRKEEQTKEQKHA